MLLYHALPVYVPKGSLLTVKGPIGTLATNQVQKFDLTVRTNGCSVTLDSSVDNSRVESTLLDKVPLSIFKIDHVLIPAGFLPHSPVKSPPVSPPTSSPGAGPAPADSPDADTRNNDNNKSSGVVKASVMFLALVTVAVSGMISSVFG
ncbi:putative fasciclin-like arabinogalactan protein [Helianthus annuus]|nr:putative fasciclin-like arabinogalactan protein [Helianthus annuus]